VILTVASYVPVKGGDSRGSAAPFRGVAGSEFTGPDVLNDRKITPQGACQSAPTQSRDEIRVGGFRVAHDPVGRTPGKALELLKNLGRLQTGGQVVVRGKEIRIRRDAALDDCAFKEGGAGINAHADDGDDNGVAKAPRIFEGSQQGRLRFAGSAGD